MNLEVIISRNQSSDNFAQISSILAPAEIQRAKASQSSDRAQKFIFTRAILRILLAEYLAINPKAVEIKAGANGKPFSSNSIYFNLSHSHELALYAFSLDSEVGIDLEYLGPRNFVGLAKRTMSASAYQAFKNLSAEQQLKVFYEYWTRKEAEIKLNGTGIFQPKSTFSASMINFVPQPDYVAAIAHRYSVSSYLFQHYPQYWL